MSSPDGGVAPWRPPELARIGGDTAVEPGEVATDANAIHQAGWLEGHAAAMAERAVAAEEAAAASAAAAAALRVVAERLRAQVTSTVGALAVAMARHLVEHELQQQPALLHQLVERALALAPMNGTVTVRLHPGDLTALESLGEMPDAATSGVELRWVGDATIGRGGCLVEGPTAIVDGRVDRALLDIYEQISHD